MSDTIRPIGRTFQIWLGLLISVWRLLAVLVVFFLVGVICLIVADGRSTGEAVYLSAITFLTIGDVAPKTTLTKVVCVLFGLEGVLFMGIVVAASIKALENA
ncbi:MAG: ion channel [bacterium]